MGSFSGVPLRLEMWRLAMKKYQRLFLTVLVGGGLYLWAGMPLDAGGSFYDTLWRAESSGSSTVPETPGGSPAGSQKSRGHGPEKENPAYEEPVAGIPTKPPGATPLTEAVTSAPSFRASSVAEAAANYIKAYAKVMGMLPGTTGYAEAMASYQTAYKDYLQMVCSTTPGSLKPGASLTGASMSDVQAAHQKFIAAYNAFLNKAATDEGYASCKNTYEQAYADYLFLVRTGAQYGTDKTGTLTNTLTNTSTNTLTNTYTNTLTNTITNTNTNTLTNTNTNTHTNTYTNTLTNTITNTNTSTNTLTNTNTNTLTNTSTQTMTGTGSGTGSGTGTGTYVDCNTLKAAIKSTHNIEMIDGKGIATTHYWTSLSTGTWSLDELKYVKEVLDILPASFTECTTGMVRYGYHYKYGSYSPPILKQKTVVSGGVQLTNLAFDYTDDIPHDALNGYDSIIEAMAYVYIDRHQSLKDAYSNQFWKDGQAIAPIPDVDKASSVSREWDFCKAVVFYVCKAAYMKQNHPERYEFIKTKVMGGKEYLP